MKIYAGHCRLKKHLLYTGIASFKNDGFYDMEPKSPELLDCIGLCKRRNKGFGIITQSKEHSVSMANGKIQEFIKVLRL